MRQYGDEKVDLDSDADAEQWMSSTLRFASPDAMTNYFKYLFERGGGNGYENAIMLHIEEHSSVDEFLEKITSMSPYVHWDLNKNLNLFIYNDVIIN